MYNFFKPTKKENIDNASYKYIPCKTKKKKRRPGRMFTKQINKLPLRCTHWILLGREWKTRTV